MCYHGWEEGTLSKLRQLHLMPDALMSRSEVLEDGVTRVDYRTAHKRAGDPDYERYLPADCRACYHQAQEAEEAGWDPPKAPDAEAKVDGKDPT